MKEENFKLTGEQYEVIKKQFKKLREEYNFVFKEKFPIFKWIGNREFLECKYVREWNPRTDREDLVAATITWRGDDVTHFLVDLKDLIKTVK